MLTFPIIDTHLHLWDPSTLRYPWLDNNEKLNRKFLLADYERATHGLSITRMVFVQCECVISQCEQEVAWVSEMAKEDPGIQGIVPLAPLEQKNVREVLERYAINPLIKGIRRIIQFESDPGFCLTPNFINGVRLLSRFNYSFDICINHTQLPHAIKLVSKCPDVRFVLDHVGKPDIANQRFDPWKKDVKELSSFPNVYCKISGLVTEANHAQWVPGDLKAYTDHILSCFGIDRLMFGGDWPVVLQAASLREWVDTSCYLFAQLNQAELRKLYHDNALKFYNL